MPIFHRFKNIRCV